MLKQIDPQVRARCVRLVREHHQEYPTLTAAVTAVGRQEGVSRDSVRRWMAQAEVDDGTRPGVTTEQMFLWMSSRFGEFDSRLVGSSGVEVVDQVAVDLAGDMAFEATHDVLLRETLLGATLDVGAGARIPAHAGQNDGVQGVVAARSPPRLRR